MYTTTATTTGAGYIVDMSGFTTQQYSPVPIYSDDQIRRIVKDEIKQEADRILVQILEKFIDEKYEVDVAALKDYLGS